MQLQIVRRSAMGGSRWHWVAGDVIDSLPPPQKKKKQIKKNIKAWEGGGVWCMCQGIVTISNKAKIISLKKT